MDAIAPNGALTGSETAFISASEMSREQTMNFVKSYLVGQFGNPHGAAGMLAGWMMARRASNVRRNRWTIELMEIRPGHRILEIGFGPGFAIEEICNRLTTGQIVGVDHSETMYRAAARRNAKAIQSGKLHLVCGSAFDENVYTDNEFRQRFDRIFGANVSMFWPDPVAVLTLLNGLLADGGAVFLTHQPRIGDTSEAAARMAGKRIARSMEEAGFRYTNMVTMPDIRPATICTIGSNAEIN